MEAFASDTVMLPEQIWDEPDRPDSHLYCGRPTGSAMPLAWAHAEYIKLLRSVKDGKVFDWIPEVANRYSENQKPTQFLEVWKFNRQICTVKLGYILRVQALAPFCLHWSNDNWQTIHNVNSTATSIDIEFVDITISSDRPSSVDFTFFWTDSQTWENYNYHVDFVD
jgi:glucoamylase